MDLLYLLNSLKRRKWIIIFSTLLGLVAGLIFSLFLKPSYLSMAQYSTGFTMEQKVKIGDNENFNIYEIDLRFNNVIQTFRSSTVLSLLSYKLLLHDLEESRPFRRLTEEQKKDDVYALANKDRIRNILRSKISRMEVLSPYNADEKKVTDLIKLYKYDQESLLEKLYFERLERTDFINIFFRSENPELSAFVVNTIGDQFIRFFNYIYGVRTQDATIKLDSLTNVKKREVDSLTAKFKEFREKIGTPNVAGRAAAAMSVVQEITSNYQLELAKLNNLRGELRSVETQLASTTVAPSTANNNAEYLRLQKRNTQLELLKNGKSVAEIQKIQQEIDSNTRQMVQLTAGSNPARTRDAEKNKNKREDLISRRIDLQQQIVAAENNVALFQKEKNNYESITATGGGEEVILKAKEDELRIASQEYERFKTSLQASQDIAVNPVSSFKQTSVGVPALKPLPSHRMLIVALSGIVMLLFSSLIIILSEFLDPSIKTPGNFQKITGLKLLSTLNQIDLRKRELTSYFHLNGQLEKYQDAALFVENMRKLRFEVERTKKKIFLVTSTKPGEGKTTVIQAIANSFSLTRKKVLLIDANFSNNTLTELYKAQPMLEEVSIYGRASDTSGYRNIVHHTRISNIDIIGCNEGNHTPSEILPHNNVLENLEKLSGQYDYIFIEGAALNTHADSKELSSYVEGIIAVFSARSSLRQSDRDSIDYLKSTGEKFAGAVLNNVEAENLDI